MAKVSVRPYIYTSKKTAVPYSFHSDEGVKDEIRYPLYYQVIFKRQNTKMKSYYGGHYKSIEDVQNENKGLIDFETKVIEQSIQYEGLIHGDDFQMKGFPDRYANYTRSISQVVGLHLKHIIWLVTNRASNNKEYQDQYFNYFFFIDYKNSNFQFNHLYNMLKKLYNNFNKYLTEEDLQTIKAYEYLEQLYPKVKDYSFKTVIEWLNHTVKNEYRNKLINTFKLNAMQAEKYVDRIEKAVQTEIKQ
jgi:hypothetical protein